MTSNILLKGTRVFFVLFRGPWSREKLGTHGSDHAHVCLRKDGKIEREPQPKFVQIGLIGK